MISNGICPNNSPGRGASPQQSEKLGVHSRRISAALFFASCSCSSGGSCRAKRSLSIIESCPPNLNTSVAYSSPQGICNSSMRALSWFCASADNTIMLLFTVFSYWRDLSSRFVLSAFVVLLSVIVICSISFLRPACCRSRGDIFLCCLAVILSRRRCPPRPLLLLVPCVRHTPLWRPCSCGYKASVPCELRALPCRP